MSKDREELIEMISEAIYREYENRPLYAQGQMNCVLSNELTQAALSAIEGAGWTVVKAGDYERARPFLATLDAYDEASAMINAYSPKPSGVEDE